MESFTPRSLISGRVKSTSLLTRKASKTRDLQTAFAAAANILGTEHIALIHSRLKDDIWYLAAPAADLASHPKSATPLTAALPGARNHAGDGAYATDLANGLQAVVVKNGSNLHSFVGAPAMVQRFMTLEGVSNGHNCSEANLPWQYASEVTGRRESQLLIGITLSGLAVAVLAAATWLWAANRAPEIHPMHKQLQQSQQAAWQQAIQTVQKQVSPTAYPPALTHLQQAIEQASQLKGSLVQYDYKQGRASWSLDVNGELVSHEGGGTP